MQGLRTVRTLGDLRTILPTLTSEQRHALMKALDDPRTGRIIRGFGAGMESALTEQIKHTHRMRTTAWFCSVVAALAAGVAIGQTQRVREQAVPKVVGGWHQAQQKYPALQLHRNGQDRAEQQEPADVAR
jgi:hypothetical protein